MKFVPPDLCQKLIKLGCESDSKFWYVRNIENKTEFLEPAAYAPDGPFETVKHNFCPAFSLEDFVGTHSNAHVNVLIIWPDESWRRHAIIDSHDWVEYLREQLEQK